MEYTNKQKKQLFEKINTLSKTEHTEIFKILKLLLNVSIGIPLRK